mmetsp:Transcript_30089/g.86642  ORF Transcript_30089/g.86642 Transcript_30089/m.86642 type:complete len:271 (+) Transcript_30089:592-1404(+)
MVPSQERIEPLSATHALNHLEVRDPTVRVHGIRGQVLLAPQVHRTHQVRAQMLGALVPLKLWNAGVCGDAAEHVAVALFPAQHPHENWVRRGLGLHVHLQRFVLPEKHLHGIEGVAAALRPAAPEQHISRQHCGLHLSVLVLWVAGACEHPLANVRRQLVPGWTSEVHAVDPHPVALQVLDRLVERRATALVRDQGAALLEDPLDGDDHGLTHHDGDGPLVVRPARGHPEALVELLNAVATLGDLSGLLDEQHPTSTLLQRLDLEHVAEV